MHRREGIDRLLQAATTIGLCVVGTLAPVTRPATAAGNGHETVLVPDLDHSRYRHFKRQGPGVVVVRVVDLRRAAADALGATGIGMENRPGTVRLDRPVATFVEESFGRLLAPGGESAPRIEIAIERFELGHRGRIFGSTKVYFDARFAVSVLGDGQSVPAGWIEFFEANSVQFSVRSKQSGLIHKGLAEMAGALDRGSLPIAEAIAGGASPPPLPTVRLGMSGVDLSAVRQEFDEAPRRTDRQMDFVPAFRLWTGSQMREAYGNSFGLAIRYGEWLSNGDGIRASLGWFYKKAHPEVLDPSWSIDTAGVAINVLPVEVTWLHPFMEDVSSPRFLPYGGLGLGALLGRQEIRLIASRAGEEIDGQAAGMHAAFGLHALAGGQLRVYGPFSLVAEASWTQAFGATKPNPKFETDADRQMWNTMLGIVRLPDFNQSGLGITVGLALTEK